MSDGTPDYELQDTLVLTTADQVAAIGNLARFRILETLSLRAATVTQLAAEHDILKGSASHHLKVLASAGLVRVVRTAKVRGGTERYWGRMARTFDVAPSNPAHSRRGLLLRTVAEDLDAAPPEADQQLLVARLRLNAPAYQRLSEGITALLAAAEADQTPDGPTANLTIALYRTAAAGTPTDDAHRPSETTASTTPQDRS